MEEPFSQLLNVHNINDVRQIEIHEVLVPDSSPIEVEITIAKLEKYKSPGSDQIPTELIQAGGETLLPEIKTFILLQIMKNCLFNESAYYCTNLQKGR
jgi:hypothetical protein